MTPSATTGPGPARRPRATSRTAGPSRVSCAAGPAPARRSRPTRWAACARRCAATRRPPAARAAGTTPTCSPSRCARRARRCSRRSSTPGSRARRATSPTTWRTCATSTRSPASSGSLHLQGALGDGRLVPGGVRGHEPDRVAAARNALERQLDRALSRLRLPLDGLRRLALLALERDPDRRRLGQPEGDLGAAPLAVLLLSAGASGGDLDAAYHRRGDVAAGRLDDHLAVHEVVQLAVVGERAGRVEVVRERGADRVGGEAGLRAQRMGDEVLRAARVGRDPVVAVAEGPVHPVAPDDRDVRGRELEVLDVHAPGGAPGGR